MSVRSKFFPRPPELKRQIIKLSAKVRELEHQNSYLWAMLQPLQDENRSLKVQLALLGGQEVKVEADPSYPAESWPGE